MVLTNNRKSKPSKYLKLALIIILGFALPIISLSQPRKYPFDYSIIFGEFFHGENVTVKIQGVDVVQNKSLHSSIVGRANLQIIQRGKRLYVNGSIAKLVNTNIKDRLEIEIFFQNKWLSYTFSLKKGIFFLVNYYQKSTNGKNELTLEQSNEPPIFL